MIYKAPNRVTDFDEKVKLISRTFLNVFFAEKNEQACSLLFNTEKNIFFADENVFSFDTIETDGKIIKHEAFLDVLMLNFLLRVEKDFYYKIYEKFVPYYLIENEEIEKKDVYDYFFEKRRRIKRIRRW